MRTDYNPDHYVTPRTSGLRSHDFRRSDDRMQPAQIGAIIVIVAVAAIVIWIGGA